MELLDTRWYGNGQSWVDIKTHMGYNQEAYDAVYAALARALEIALRSQTTPERVDGCPRRSRAFWWCPARRGVPGAGRADEWRGLTVLEYMVKIG